MSARKRKFETDVKPKIESILGAQALVKLCEYLILRLDHTDLLVQIKPRLNDPKRSAEGSLISDLHKLAAVAESVCKQRPHTSHEWLAAADSLDREGVNLWNTSSSLKTGSDDAVREVLAALRLAGFRLIEVGLEPKPPIETLIHVLQLASKAGASLSETGRHESAAAVLTSAAKYEEQVRTVDDPEQNHQQTRSQAIILYYLSRMEAAWREGNDAVSEFMLQKITGHFNHRDLKVNYLSKRELLAAKLLEIGKAVLRNIREAEAGTEKTLYHTAIRWLQKAFYITETSAEDAEMVSQELKHSILKSLARGYYLSSSHDPDDLHRAEASLNELIRNANMDVNPGSAEQQQLRWMRLAVLRKRNAAESELLDGTHGDIDRICAAFESIIDHMRFSDTDITDILQELKALRDQHSLVVSVHRHCLQMTLEVGKGSSSPHVDRLLLSLLFHCSKDADHVRAMRDIEEALTLAESAELELPKVPTTACLTLLWQFGDRHYNAKRWAAAADWYLCGTHPVFATMARSSHSKCFRKAALCYIQGKEFSTASAVLRRCPGNEAATHYVALLCAVQQGNGSQSPIEAVKDMASAPDFDRKMLLLATQLANESDMKALLLSVLETLLKMVQNQPEKDIHVEGLSLIRCVIRLVVKLMGEPAANGYPIQRFQCMTLFLARILVTQFQEKNGTAVIAKDISWLWRTAYNCAVQGCTEWEDEEAVSHLFDLARQLLEIYCTSVLTEADAELSAYVANATFAAVAGRSECMLILFDERGCEQAEAFAFRKRVENAVNAPQSVTVEIRERVNSFICTMRTFQVEASCHMKDWKQTTEVIENAVHSGTTTIDALEAIADILWVQKDCPMYDCTQAILHASLNRSSLSVEKFSRWLRAICTILLSRNGQDDRTRAIGYVEQAINVLEEHSDDRQDDAASYPEDERQWLLGTAYNTGVECFHASLPEEAKRWFEAATVICRYTSDGKIRAEKISDTYSHLLAQLSSRKDEDKSDETSADSS
ncbi:hypothetical protein BC629DRAFT_1284035 [Irpex lacteus]|nr:hypothetical protein BC629DRAFT_1284035 [Irpex lacteus]